MKVMVLVSLKLTLALGPLTASAASVQLASGHYVSVDAFDPAPKTVPANVYFSYPYADNIVAATQAEQTFATSHNYAEFNPPMTFYAAAAPNLVPLKTYWSPALNDTLTTSTQEGIAFATDPANGYTFKQIEGYCSPTKPTPSTGTDVVITYTQMWSGTRKDSFIVAVGSGHEDSAKSAGYTSNWTECYVLGGGVPNATGNWTLWVNQPQAGIPWPKSTDLLGWEYLSGANPGYGGGDHVSRSADTWYPSWSSDGNLYSPWTDGSVHDDVTGQRIGSGSGGRGTSKNSTTGQAVIIGDNPFNLTITQVKTFTSSTYPYEGRYPCGSLVYNGTWWYGTYYLDNPNATVGNTYVGPNPGPNCGNWCVQGPVVDFRHSFDKGATWNEDRLNATDGSDNLFSETAANNSKVKFGAPHWVDFGQELEHTPDGKAYLVGHGASRPDAVQAWMLGDEIYMARVNPTVEDISDKTKWEFYSGGVGPAATWTTGDISKAVPLVTWEDKMGVVTMTYFNALRKYIMTVSTATYWPSMVREFDTYFLESDSITGPWSYVNYNSKFGPEAYFVNHPSKFLAAKANTTASPPVYDAFLMYSANFAFHSGSNPPNSNYHMNLQQSRFPLSASFAAKLERIYAEEQANKDGKGL